MWTWCRYSFGRCLSVRCQSTVASVGQKLRRSQWHKKNDEKKSQPHVFRSLYPWKTKADLVECLHRNVMYNQDGLVAINKPYGLGVHKSTSAAEGESPFCMDDIMEELGRRLGHSAALQPIKFTERFTSGVSLLTTSDETAARVRRCYAVNESLKLPTFAYWAVTLGQPAPDERALHRSGLSWVSSRDDLKTKLPILVETFTPRKVATGHVKPFQVSHATLDCSSDEVESVRPCLVDVSAYSTGQHRLRVYLAHQLAPVLGDHIYGNRTALILGQRLPLNPFQAANLSTFQKVPSALLAKLRIGDSSQVPHCMHLRRVTLARWTGKRSGHLVLTAAVAPHFQFVCDSFGLQLPSDDGPP